MKIYFPPKNRIRQRGMALVVVLTVVVLITSLLVAFLVSVRTDRQSSEIYAGSVSTRLLAESALNLSMAQVKAATADESGGSAPRAWASQPGMIRSFNTNGSLHRAYKLYTWPNMTATTFSANSAAEQPPSDWASKPALFTDLNAPQRGSYPIMSPAAIGKVEGFDIANAPGTDAAAPVMPVYWLYQLEDGTVVVPEAGTNSNEVRVPGATTGNPIVGRIAFWTDDESSKLNINTSSEGQFWDTPRWMTTRELHMGMSQPTRREYQRYPGHPFTTSLSPALAGYSADTTGSILLEPTIQSTAPFVGSFAASMGVQRFLRRIFEISPRAQWGGSQGGTIPFSYNTPPVTLDEDRLYATVDELAFQEPVEPGRKRNRLEGPDSALSIDQNTLEELRFFLTSSSRAPEVNLFNQPRVSIWPVDDHTRLNPARQGPQDPARGIMDQRSPLDRLLAFCSTIGREPNRKAFYFTRANPMSATADLAPGSRNLQLYNYLANFLETPIPGFGQTFQSKYAQDHKQILTQIFDYIRITNLLYAGGPSPDAAYQSDFRYAFSTPPGGAGGTSDYYKRHMLAYAAGDEGGPSTTSGTTIQYAASGQVVPIQGPDGTKGFGNFPTLSSAALMSIVRHVSPRDDNGNWNYFWDTTQNTWVKLTETNKGTYGVVTVGNGIPACPDNYYRWESLADGGDYNGGSGDIHSPFDTTLPDGHIRTQSILLVNPYLVSPGYPGVNADYRIVISGLNNFQADGASMGFPAEGTLIMAGNFLGPTGTDKTLTSYYSNFAPSPGLMTTYLGRNLGRPSTPTRHYYPFFAENQPVVKASSFQFTGGALDIQIRTNGHYGTSSETIQSMQMVFPNGIFQSPVLPEPPPTPWDAGWGENWINHPDVSETERQKRRTSARNTAYAIRHFGDSHDSSGTVSSASNLAPGRYGRFRQDTEDGWSRGDWSYRFILPRVMLTSGTVNPPGIQADQIADLVQGVEIATGDVRTVAALRTVPAGKFAANVNYETLRAAHSFRRGNYGSPYFGARSGSLVSSTNYFKAVYYRTSSAGNGNLGNVSYEPMVSSLIGPGSFPPTWNQGGDWDSGISRMPDGPYINKPDEGTGQGNIPGGEAPYFAAFHESSYFSMIGANRVSPNRIIPSPVMFGSLPTGINSGRPWQTLLFAPNPRAGDAHFALQTGVPDHLILDLFTMPVVEPYAISEPFSTAGKVNMNYRMVPFPHITRSTALRGVLKSVKLSAVPESDINVYKGQQQVTPTTVSTTSNYRYAINANETLKAFEAKFDAGSGPQVFKSASEICEMFLYPDNQGSPGLPLVTYDSGGTAIRNWWANKTLTGDNMREQPYAVIYPRLTTKSNTFTVHMKVETLTKVKADADQDVWREGRDVVRAQYRGSATFERFIDPNEPGLEAFDYATSTDPPALDEFYRFRIVSVKEFQP